MKTKLTIFIFVMCMANNISWSQDGPPPQMAMPNDKNTALIDKIIEVSEHEIYFKDYCSKKVKEIAKEENWNSEKTKQILESIRFDSYISSVYNSFAFYTEQQLRMVIDTMIILNKENSSGQKFILNNEMMQNNLDIYVTGVIEGKYIMKK